MEIVIAFVLGCIVGAGALSCYSIVAIGDMERMEEDEEQEEYLKSIRNKGE